jgi:hypothetical protein
MFGGSFRGMAQIKGKILCVSCTVEEIRRTQPQLHNLYLLTHKQERAVMQIAAVENSVSGRESLLGRWEAVTGLTQHLVIRGEDQLWRTLTAEENVQREVALKGIVQSTGTFDVAEVTILQ